MKKRLSILLICCVLTLSLGTPTLALVFVPPEGGGEAGGSVEIPEHNVGLGALTIGEGQTVSYTVVGSQFNPEEGSGFYAGQLNLTVTGPVVIESGGCLSIGPISVGGTEKRPVIKAELGETPLITVKAGGQLIIHYADFALTGTGTLIKQEPGAAVSLTGSTGYEDAVEWSGAVVDNGDTAPKNVHLEAGTPLTPELLPSVLDVAVLDRGQESYETLALSWELGEHHGQSEGKAELTGSFLDENGEVLHSLRPLTLTVYWYETGELTVTDARWTGDEAVTAALLFDELPDGLQTYDVWGQTSPDGEVWTDFYDFDVTGDPDEGYTAIFYLYDDNEPRYFRLAASNSDGSKYWYSRGFLLPTEEDSDEDQGGNRGGSTTLFPPLREPEPSPTPTPEPTPTPTPTPEPTPEPTYQPPILGTTDSEHTISPAPEPTPTPTPEPTPEPTSEPTPEPTPEPAPTASPGSEPAEDVEIAAPDMPERSSTGGADLVTTVVLAAAGIAVCGVVGAAAAGLFKKRK